MYIYIILPKHPFNLFGLSIQHFSHYISCKCFDFSEIVVKTAKKQRKSSAFSILRIHFLSGGQLTNSINHFEQVVRGCSGSSSSHVRSCQLFLCLSRHSVSKYFLKISCLYQENGEEMHCFLPKKVLFVLFLRKSFSRLATTGLQGTKFCLTPR